MSPPKFFFPLQPPAPRAMASFFLKRASWVVWVQLHQILYPVTTFFIAHPRLPFHAADASSLALTVFLFLV